jgi:hypothetical protein
MCEEFEKDRVLDPLTNYFNYLNKILGRVLIWLCTK